MLPKERPEKGEGGGWEPGGFPGAGRERASWSHGTSLWATRGSAQGLPFGDLVRTASQREGPGQGLGWETEDFRSSERVESATFIHSLNVCHSPRPCWVLGAGTDSTWLICEKRPGEWTRDGAHYNKCNRGNPGRGRVQEGTVHAGGPERAPGK